LRQTTKRNCAKQPNETAPNNQTKQRQTTKRNCAKQPNEIAPNNQIKSKNICFIQRIMLTLQQNNKTIFYDGK